MTPEERDKKLNEFRAMSIDALKVKIGSGEIGSFNLPNADRQIFNLAKIALDEKENIANQIRFNQSLKISEDNVKATKNLYRATWGLVIVTAILALVTFFKK